MTNLNQFHLTQAIRVAQLEELVQKVKRMHFQVLATICAAAGGEIRLTSFDYREANGKVLESWTDPETGDQCFRLTTEGAPPIRVRETTELERYQDCRFAGVQVCEAGELAWFQDPVTQSSFLVSKGQTLRDGLESLQARFREAQMKEKSS